MDAEHISKCLGELLPHTVDRLAREKPSAPYGLWPVAQASYEDGFRTISYGQFANLINGLAWWIKKTVGTSQNGDKVLAYVGPNDVRFTALLLAAVKAGCVVSWDALDLYNSDPTDAVGLAFSYFAAEQRSRSAVPIYDAEVPDVVDKWSDSAGRPRCSRQCQAAPEPLHNSRHRRAPV